MTLQTLPLSKIQPSTGNPRKNFDDATIAGLALSIKTDGLLQNLIVGKPKGRKKMHPIICGERRFRALSLLQEQGDLPEDYEVTVEIKTDLSDEQTQRIATMENMQREDLSPMEEAEAIKLLVQDGDKLDDIVAKTGLAVATIKRRLALTDLCEAAKQALIEGELTLSKAEALSIGSHEQQERVLGRATSSYNDAEDVKDMILGNLPSVSMAIFDKAEYTGDFTQDLLAEDDATYFNDFEQFFELQKAAAEKLVEEHSNTAEWAELLEGHFHSWEYGEAPEGEKGGVIVAIHSDGEVEVHEGLTKTKADKSTTDALKKPKPTYSTPLVRNMSMHKSVAVQAALLGNPRKAKELAVTQKLYRFKNHDALIYFMQEGYTPPALKVINDKCTDLLGLFGVDKEAIEQDEDRQSWHSLGYMFSYNMEGAYMAVQSLSDEQLEEILVALEVLEFGQSFVDRLDTNADSLFNKIAADLNVDMRDYWRPDEAFLKRRNKEQLLKIISEAGCSQKYGSAAGYKKKELVSSMAKHFQHVLTLEAPNQDELKATFWIPEAMQFPAINPDAKDEPEEEDFEESADFEDEEEYAEAA